MRLSRHWRDRSLRWNRYLLAGCGLDGAVQGLKEPQELLVLQMSDEAPHKNEVEAYLIDTLLP